MREKEVWERVSRELTASREPLRQWCRESLEMEAWYREQAAAGGRERAALLRLADREAQNGGCLGGMLLSAGLTPPRRTSPGERRSLPDMLACSRRAGRNYAGLTPDPEFGTVFAAMARRQTEQTEGLLHLMNRGFVAR